MRGATHTPSPPPHLFLYIRIFGTEEFTKKIFLHEKPAQHEHLRTVGVTYRGIFYLANCRNQQPEIAIPPIHKRYGPCISMAVPCVHGRMVYLFSKNKEEVVCDRFTEAFLRLGVCVGENEIYRFSWNISSKI